MRIMFVGDINLGEYYTSFGHGPKTYAASRNPFSAVEDIFREADFVVGNLEAAITNHNIEPDNPESMVLRADPEHARYLADVGFQVLQVANNHTVQHGKTGFNETVSTLRSIGISAIGIADQGVHIIEIGDIRVGFLAASDVPDNTDLVQTSYRKFDSDFKKLVIESVDKVDHLFVLLHWGLEASTSPLEYQKVYASELAKIGVRGVIGQHPHLFYKIYQEKDTVIAPSLGNFLFDLGWDDRLLKSGILDIKLTKKTMNVKVRPVKIDKNGYVPKPSGPPINLVDSVEIYHLGESMKGEQLRKLKYFWMNIFKGKTKLKLRFFIKKLIK
jgi:poly-gamma-glutamate capsule biosynthesis protein CapA/YwtB (metallophosphatase superfamily)